MRKLINLVLFLLAAVGLASAQTFNVNQIRPSATNGQIVTTVGGQTVWANSGSQFLVPFTPPASGQYVILTPSSYTLTTGGAQGGGPTGSVTGSDSSVYITNGPYGNTISNNSWGITWSGFSLPSYVSAANVTAIYAVAVSGEINNTGAGVHFAFTCSGNANNLVPSIGATSWPLQQTSSTNSTAAASISSITCEAQTTRSISVYPDSATVNVTGIALFVYYTGTAPPQQSGIVVEPPLYFNPALDQLGIDPYFPTDLQGISYLDLPSPATDQLVLVYDSADCATSGSGPTVCISNGTAWSPLTAGFANPMTTAGDIIIGGSGGTPTRLGIGTNGYILTVVSGVPAWAPAPSGVTSVTASGFLQSSGGTTPAITVAHSQGSDTNLLTSGTVSGAGNPLCVDSNTGAATQVCNTPIALPYDSATTISGQIMWMSKFTVQFVVPASCSGSYFYALTGATVSATFTLVDITNSATTYCTATFASGGSGGAESATFSGPGGTISAGDIVEWVSGSSDTTLAGTGGQLLVVR